MRFRAAGVTQRDPVSSKASKQEIQVPTLEINGVSLPVVEEVGRKESENTGTVCRRLPCHCG